uniref:E3 ubiquitin-protein ligase n=1 Tax=Cyprinodon variegatus TaxID=28743 RepID=A0A3Q2CHL7_CYPVA
SVRRTGAKMTADYEELLLMDNCNKEVGLVLSMPSLYQEEGIDLQPSAVSSAFNNMYIFHLVTMAHILQVLLTSSAAGDGEDCPGLLDFSCLFFPLLLRLVPDLSGGSVAQRIKAGIEPFLRCAALFFNCLTGVHPPEELLNASGQVEALCGYLALPLNIFQLFQDYRDVVSPLYPRIRNRLIELPEDYSSLLNKASHFQCPKSTIDERKHPTLCLVCGAMLCSQSSCCLSQLDGEDVGACTAHAAVCGAGVGMFLRIRECEIVLMASRTRGSTYPAPYLDDYGETDPHLGRGNPLHLCSERYRKLNQLWQQHCILEEIARSLEVVNVMFAFEWQLV